MNKALHVLVYVFLALAIAALMFELQLSDKRALLRDRNRMQEDYLVKIAKTIEKTDAPKTTAPELKLDTSPVEAKLVDSPETENILEEYAANLEQSDIETFNWEGQREALRQVYVMDGDKPAMDGGEPMKSGSPEDKLLAELFESSKKQLARLNTTRAELMTLRGKLVKVVEMVNKLKPEARQDKVTIAEKTEKLEKLEGEKNDLEGQITKKNAEIDELNTSITSLHEEANAAKEEVSAKEEELDKCRKLVEQMKRMLIEAAMPRGAQSAQGADITALTAGNKGKIVEADNENMFAVVEFDEATMKELKGEKLDKSIPILELSVRRPGYQGEAGDFVGRIRLRQEVKGKPYVICDILSAWEQDKLQVNDTVFAD